MASGEFLLMRFFTFATLLGILRLRPGHTGKGEQQQELTMHALDWLKECGRILRGAIQPIECILFAP